MSKPSPYLMAFSAGVICFFLWSAVQEAPSSDGKYSQSVSKTKDKSSRIDSLSSQDGNVDAPLFILQVGPSKTGTSTLQYFAFQNMDLLQDDNVYYIGHYGKRNKFNTHEMASACYRCDGGPRDEICDKKWADFEQRVNEHHSQNHTVLMVEEMLSNFAHSKCEQVHLWDRLIPLLSKWRVQINFTYRRYNEWLPSQYIQLYNPDGCGNNKRKIKDRQSWPKDGGKTIPPFPEFFQDFGDHNYRSPIMIAKKWMNHFKDVEVYNMHSGGDFLQNWFCHHVPEARQVCIQLNENNESVTMNPSSTKHLHYDMLTMEAYNRGWINEGMTRPSVNRAVEARALELGFATLVDFPTVCLSDEQAEELLSRTLTHEKELLPELYASIGEDEIQLGFEAAAKKGMYCSIDANKVFEDSSWKDFFTHLNSGSEISS